MPGTRLGMAQGRDFLGIQAEAVLLQSHVQALIQAISPKRKDNSESSA